MTSSELKSRSKSQKRSKQPLSIIEVAEAALLGDLALGLQLIGWFISIGALIQWFSVVPFALITVRHRKRATYFATASTIGISVLIGGATLGLQVFLAGVLGVAVGEAFVKNRNFIYTAFITIVKGAIPAAVIGELLLIIFSKARTLTINQIKVVWDGIGNILKGMGKYLKSHPYVSKKSSPNAFDQLVHKMGSGLYRFSISFEHLIKWITSHWYLLFPLSIIISMLIVSVAMDIISRPLLKLILKNLRQPAVEFRADEEFDISFENSLSQERNGISEFTDESIARRTNDEQVVAPLPVKLENVSFSYKNSARPTIDQINIDISKEEFVGVVGQNGSGKSTIGKVLIGMKPDSGTVQRNGKVGLGQIAGTSVIFQRPESQVLGSMVEDDVVWGLSEKTATEVDVDKILAEVGLEGFGKRETSQLSGGELQRLAIASALARKPALLISDESTALLDPSGREKVLSLLKKIAEDGAGVVHISHILNELYSMNKIYLIENGKIRGTFKGFEADQYRHYLDSYVNTDSATDQLFRSDRHNHEDDNVAEAGQIVNDFQNIGEKISSISAFERLLAISTDFYRSVTEDYANRVIESETAKLNSVPLVILENLGHVYLAKTPWENRALKDINLAVYSGESIMIVGENGSGKTTLSWVLAGLIEPSEGTISWQSQDRDNRISSNDPSKDAPVSSLDLGSKNLSFEYLPQARSGKKIYINNKKDMEFKKSQNRSRSTASDVTSAIVFQHAAFQLTERDVKNSVRPIITLKDMTSDDLVSACLAAVGFPNSNMLTRSIYELSGGELKRVAIASVLALMPKVVIFDEPLAGLDYSSKLKVRDIIKSLSNMGMATIVVSHDFEDIIPVCNRVIGLNQGRVVFDGDPESWEKQKEQENGQ